jgi:hypothetical protein
VNTFQVQRLEGFRPPAFSYTGEVTLQEIPMPDGPFIAVIWEAVRRTRHGHEHKWRAGAD